VSSDKKVKVALVAVGLGRVQRGFERWANDLWGMFREHPGVELTLYRSRQATRERECVPGLLWPVTRLIRSLPIGAIAGAEQYKRDCIAFALCLLPDLIRQRFDVIHVVDPPLAIALSQLRRIIPCPGRLLFTEGCDIPPDRYPRVDHLHHVARSAYEAGLASGVPAAQMTFVPSGLHTARFAPSHARNSLRRKHGVSNTTFVVLVVSALKRQHKRVDHAIEEVSRLNGDVMLWMDGNPEDPEVFRLAKHLLGQRCRITHVSSEDVAELYQLADVMVHPSLAESFGLTIVEALCSGLPVLIHRAPHFEWLVPDEDCHVDMTRPGELADRLQRLSDGRQALAERANLLSASVRSRFDWHTVLPRYFEMYKRVAAMNGASPVGVDRSLLASKRKLQNQELA
jgi:glycosyltransferase involved in cell wall biosynthesis